MKPPSVVALSVLLACACISTKQTVRPGGDAVWIALKDGTRCSAELLALSPTTLYFVRDRQVCREPLADVTRIHIESAGLNTTKYVTLGLIGIGDGAVAWFAASGCANYFAAAAIPAVFAVGALSTLLGGPQADFKPPFRPEELELLASRCRYPQGLTDEQWQELLRYYHQDAFLEPDGLSRP